MAISWRKKMKNKSLFTKLISYFLIFTVLILSTMWLFNIVFFKEIYTQKKRELIQNTEKEISSYSGRDLVSFLNSVASKTRLGIIIFDENGLVLYPNYLLELDKEDLEFVKSNEDSVDYIKKHDDREYLVFLKRYETVNAKLYMKLIDNLDEDGSVKKMLKEELLYISLVAIVLALALSYFLAKKLTKPIKNLSEASKFLGTKSFSVEEEGGYEEIEELKKSLESANDDLKRTMDFRENIIANVSHDFKTPLSVIKSYAEMIKDITGDNKEKREENLGTIISEADRLNTMINEMLEASKNVSALGELNLEKVSLEAISKEIIDKLNTAENRERIKLDVSGDTMVMADEKKIRSVIYNYLSNALNYSNEGEDILVRITEEEKGVRYEVIDHGMGIKEEDIKRIWDRYYISSANHELKKYSTGLGLYIAREVLLLHKAEFGVESSYGKGSNFYFVLKKGV